MRRIAAIGLAWVVLPACDGCGQGGAVVTGAIESVAQCLTTRGDVRRRLSTGTAWNSIEPGTDLYAGDWVQTAVRARATVGYRDGTQLTVEPSSTVVIEAPGGDGQEETMQRIAVRSGSVQAGLPSGAKRPVQVRLPSGRTISVRSRDPGTAANVRIDVDVAGTTEVAVTQGTASLITADGQEVALAAGTAQQVDEGSAGPQVQLPSAPSLPALEAGTRYEGEPLPIIWQAPGSGARFVVELSRDPNFTDVDVEIGTTDPEATWTPPEPGRWYVRVTTEDEDGRRSPPSEVRSVEVRRDDRLRLLRAPEDGAVFEVDRLQVSIDFSWGAPPDGGPYRLLVSRQSDLSEVEATVFVQTESTSIRLPRGVFYWGVFRDGEDGEAARLFVAPFRFEVTASTDRLRVPRRLDWRR